MRSDNALCKKKLVKVFAVKALVQGNLETSVLPADRRGPFKLQQQLVKILYFGIYFHCLYAAADSIDRTVVYQGSTLQYGKVCTNFLNFIQQVARENNGLAVCRDLLDEFAYLGDAHGIETVGGLV